jgi:hypothetical protein
VSWIRGAIVSAAGARSTTTRARRSSTRAAPDVRTAQRNHAPGSPAWRAATAPAKRAARVVSDDRSTMRPLQGISSRLVVTLRPHSSLTRRLIAEICDTHSRRSACSMAMISPCGQWK